MTTSHNNLYEDAAHAVGPAVHDDETFTHTSATETVEPRFVHPDAKAMFKRCPWMRNIPIYGEACEGFGPKCTWALGLCYVMNKGLADYLLQNSAYAMIVNRFGVEGNRYQRLFSIVLTGWSIKAFTAVLCDSFAFLGYTKRWYMLISCVAGAVFALMYGLLPAKQSSASIAAAFIFLSSYCKANVDILSEGHYSRLMRRNPRAGPSIVSWIWWFVLTGALISALIVGPLADAKIPQVSIFISAALQLCTCVFFVFNWYGEGTNRHERAEDARRMHEELLRERAKIAAQNASSEHDSDAHYPDKDLHPERVYSDEEARQRGAVSDPMALDDGLNVDAPAAAASRGDDAMSSELVLPEPVPCLCGLFEFNKEVVLRNWRVVVYSAVMTCAVVALTCGNMLADTLGLLIICLVVSVICCGMSFWALPMVIAKANVFGYLQNVCYISISGLTAYYLAGEDCVPGGPHFSYTFLNTVGALIGNVFGVVGVSIFSYLFSTSTYKKIFFITTAAAIVSSMFDFSIYMRWNVAIGIPDHAMYIFGDAIIAEVISMLNFMPQVILLSRLCPRGSESVVYALMAGFSNFGKNTASSLGAVMMEYRWPIKETVPCDFSNLFPLIIIVGLCLPWIVIPLTFILLPSARVCDNIDIDGNVIAAETKNAKQGTTASAQKQQRTPESQEPAVLTERVN